ncbi:phage tail protein [Ensifer adhaerens]|uniref:phage tail protein n=1 Tax=Ensifer adhaerens TaxID=106592 RepID=UPI000DC57D1F|nr:tail fiber protein [Ensifer adhaerens]RAS01910.1 microcystin-dependent protein [Ensifer adhaerens]
MSEPFIGEIQLFGFNFAPLNWAFCNGATLAVRQNTALFSLLGVAYGGNGSTTFQLPNFTGRAAFNQGIAPGLSQRTIGEVLGENSVTLSNSEMPAHSHGFTIYNQTDTAKRASAPSAGNALTLPIETSVTAKDAQPNAPFASNMIGLAGNNLPHENRQPYLAVNFCIALYGNYPTFG